MEFTVAIDAKFSTVKSIYNTKWAVAQYTSYYKTKNLNRCYLIRQINQEILEV